MDVGIFGISVKAGGPCEIISFDRLFKLCHRASDDFFYRLDSIFFIQTEFFVILGFKR